MFKKAKKHKSSRLRIFMLVVAFYIAAVYLITAIIPAPRAVSLNFGPKSARNVTFLADLSGVAPDNTRQLDQQIFDAVLEMIAQAHSLIVLDMFLFNDWQGPVSESHRALSQELTDALIAKKQSQPSLHVTVISDPVNAVYGGLPSTHFVAMRSAGIDVVLTDLTQLQDSNPLYSGIWRWLIKPFGNSPGSALPNPFGPGKVSIRSYLALLNFKANHRKLMVADKADGELLGFISSANPHDGSSAHRNVALTFSGEAAVDMLVSEAALLSMSGAESVWKSWPETILSKVEQQQRLVVQNSVMENSDRTDSIELPESKRLQQANTQQDTNTPNVTNESASPTSAAELQIISESRIKSAVLSLLSSASATDRIDLVMFYLSDRDIVNALKEAHARGVQLRVLLDVNKDAFGRTKKGVPNRPVAAELAEVGIPVRWCATGGEQCHAKMIYRIHFARFELILGSGNYTRRNLDDYNLETNARLNTSIVHPVAADATAYFETQWSNSEDRTYSYNYEQLANDSLWLTIRYRFMEATGFGTF